MRAEYVWQPASETLLVLARGDFVLGKGSTRNQLRRFSS